MTPRHQPELHEERDSVLSWFIVALLLIVDRLRESLNALFAALLDRVTLDQTPRRAAPHPNTARPREPERVREILPPEVVKARVPKQVHGKVQEALDEAAEALNRLRLVGLRLRAAEPALGSTIAAIVDAANRLSDRIAAEPERFHAASRVFSYYLPSTLQVSEALLSVSGRALVNDAEGTLASVLAFLRQTETGLDTVNLAVAKLELRLLNDALRVDLNP